MKAMALTALRRIEPTDYPTPSIEKDSDVLVRLSRVGVCGSDIHYYVSGQIGKQVVTYPFLVGHEASGIVEKVGAGVSRVKPGDRVAIDPAMPCWECDQCKAGRSHTCRNLKFLGCPNQAEGCLSEFIVMPETSLFPIREQMSLDEAALSEPLAIGVYAVEQSIPMEGAKVGILGMGPIGLSVLLPARAQGAAKVYATDRIDGRLQVAETAGVDLGVNAEADDRIERILEAEPDNLDVVFECCGKQEAIDDAIKLLKPGGKLMIIGIPSFPCWSFPVDELRHKEINIQNVRRQNECVQKTLDMMDAGAFDANVMVTHRYGFEKTPEAFDLVADYQDGVVKAMIDFPE